MMMLLKGLSLVISGTKPIYFNDTPNFTMISQDSLLGELVPALPIPNAVLILFLVAIVASVVLNKTRARPLHLRARAATRRRCGCPA
jgi:ribose transport system permease protein